MISKSGVTIKYNDVALGAKENFAPYANEKEDFVNLSQFQQEDLIFPLYANPCELNAVVLDKSTEIFPDDPENQNMGLWSKQISDRDGKFHTPIVVEFVANGQYTSIGITLTFDEATGAYANHVNIKWYRDEELLSDMDFRPNSVRYFCANTVENYTKVVVTFYSITNPFNRLKFHVIDYGLIAFFGGDELRNAKVVQEISPISSEISINTADFTLDSKTDLVYSFQSKQPITVYFNGVLRATAFVKQGKRKGRRLWDVTTEDYIGLMESITFVGDVYVNKNAVELIDEIFSAARIPYEIDENFSDIFLTGYIPYTNCREALMQVAFAIQAAVDTSGSRAVKIFKLNDDVTQEIPLTRIMQGQSFTEDQTITRVSLAYHAYTKSSETQEIYKAETAGVGSGILVTFNEPYYNLSISNGSIVKSGTNYAIINANDGCIMSGYKYDHVSLIKSIDNPLVLATELEKVVEIKDATLVSQSNVDKVLEICYNYVVNTAKIQTRIVEGKHDYGLDPVTQVADVVAVHTEYNGIRTGRITRQTYNLNGGIIIKDSVIAETEAK